MRKSVTITSGNYTSTPYLGAVVLPVGDYALGRLLARLAGNTGAAGVGVYVAASGKTTLTDAERAAGEVYYDAAVAAAADPAPELNVLGTPIPFEIRSGECLYLYMAPDGGDSAVSGSIAVDLV